MWYSVTRLGEVINKIASNHLILLTTSLPAKSRMSQMQFSKMSR